MDNLPAHKVAGVKEAIEAAGATRVFLPLLIPNPIDQHPWAQSLVPMDMIFQGWSMREFQA